MSHLITANDLLTGGDHYFFAIGDGAAADADGDRDDSVPPDGAWVGTGQHEAMVKVIEEGPDKKVRVEVWDGLPPLPPTDHELTHTFTLDLPHGEIGIYNAGGYAEAAQILPGRYNVRLTGWNRERTAQQYRRLGERYNFDARIPEFAEGEEALTGQERYLAQFWPAHHD